MNKEKKQFLFWTTIAGVLFLILGIHDLFFLQAINKSGFIILLEFFAGFCFLLVALMRLRKN